MRKITYRSLWIFCFTVMSMTIHAQHSFNKNFQTDMVLPIKDYGKVYNVPFAGDRPDPNTKYKIIFEGSLEPFDSSVIYPPLELAARMYNLHVYGGASQKNMDVVVVVGGEAIPAMMNNEAYRKRFGIDNPNLKILEELKAAGVKLNGCSQAMTKHFILPADLNPIVSPVFSRFTTVSGLQLKGYAYFKF